MLDAYVEVFKKCCWVPWPLPGVSLELLVLVSEFIGEFNNQIYYWSFGPSKVSFHFIVLDVPRYQPLFRVSSLRVLDPGGPTCPVMVMLFRLKSTHTCRVAY